MSNCCKVNTYWDQESISCYLVYRPFIPDSYDKWPTPKDVADKLKQEIEDQIRKANPCNSPGGGAVGSGGGVNTGPEVPSLPSVGEGRLVSNDGTMWVMPTRDSFDGNCGNCRDLFPEKNIRSYDTKGNPARCTSMEGSLLNPNGETLGKSETCKDERLLDVAEKDVEITLTYETEYIIEYCGQTFNTSQTWTKKIKTHSQKWLFQRKSTFYKRSTHLCCGDDPESLPYPY